MVTRSVLLNIADVSGIEDPASDARAVEDWARSAWEAYGELHLLAREWLAMSAAHLAESEIAT